ncbi:radical SAM protein [Methanocaldococcus indicus]|uniref:radical SAM protein n=1 Tax=Methanocaldococcus indicus TaxID=213231 RepID=UPI003C6D81F2
MFLLLCLSRKCNLNCIGCHAHKSDELVHENNLKFFKRALIHTLQQYRPREICFHGAETFVCSETVLKEVLEIINKYKIKEAKLSCMSNGTLVTEKKYNLMKQFGVCVNISYRGPEDLYKKITRTDTYADWLEGIYLVKPKSTIFYYPTELEDEILNRYKEIVDDIVDKGFKSVRFSEYCSSTPNKRHSEFVIKCQKYIIKMGYDLQIPEIVDLLKRIQGLQPKMSCSWEHNCMQFFCLQPNGKMTFCNRNMKSYRAFYKECYSCEAYPFCKGGCEAVREKNGGIFPYCDDRRKIVRYVRENYFDLASYYDIM